MKRKNIALSIVLIIAMFFLFSIFFVEQSNGHDCLGENCEICQQVSIYEKKFKELSSAVTAFVLGLSIVFSKSNRISLLKSRFYKKDSLISLKIELDA